MTKDTIAGLRAWMHEPDYIEDGFSLESVVAWINRRPIGAFEQMASELATLRESLAKAEEKSSAWHRLALDVGVERDEARDRALAAESKLAEAKRALVLWRDSHLMTEDGAPVDPRQLNSYGGDVVMAAAATRSTLTKIKEAGHVAG